MSSSQAYWKATSVGRTVHDGSFGRSIERENRAYRPSQRCDLRDTAFAPACSGNHPTQNTARGYLDWRNSHSRKHACFLSTIRRWTKYVIIYCLFSIDLFTVAKLTLMWKKKRWSYLRQAWRIYSGTLVLSPGISKREKRFCAVSRRWDNSSDIFGPCPARKCWS